MSNWIKGKVGDLLQGLESGVSVNGHDRAPMPDECSVLKVSSVTYGIFNSDSAKPIKEKDAGRAKCNPRKGQIIISRSNTPELVGASALVDQDYPHRYLSDKLWQTVPHPNIKLCTKWLSFVLSSPEVRYKLSQLATGSSNSMKNITKDELLSLPILIPPHSEQKIISDTLEKWDTAIEKTEALIDAKERQFGWLKSKLLRTALEDYKDNIKSLPDVCKIRTGKKDVNQGNPDGQYPFFTCAKDHTFSDSYSYDMEAILLAGNGYIGNPILYRGKFEAYQRTYILHDFTHVDAEYLSHLLRRNLQKKIAQEKQEGAMSYIKLGTLQSIEIVVPPIEEQKRIAHTLNTAQQEITLLKKLADQYRTQKRGLMQKLLSGEWHIKNKEAA